MIEKVEYPEFHTFAEGVQYLEQGNYIDYEVKIDKHSGALLTRASWLDAVHDGTFMDYDGMGDQVDSAGNIIKTSKFGGWIHPSEANELVPECAYILWYNK